MVAGTLGLPWEPLRIGMTVFSAFAQGLGYEDWDYERFRIAVEEFYKNMAGDYVGEMLTYGVTRGLPNDWGIDLNSRMSLDSLLLFGEPRENDRQGWGSYLFSLLTGPAGSNLMGSVAAASNALSGDYRRVGDIVPIKFVADTWSAWTRTNSGEFNLQDAVLRAIGFTSARQANIQTDVGRDIRDSRLARNERTRLERAFINARTPDAVARATSAIREYNRSLPEGQREISLTALRNRVRRDLQRFEN
jgi:hypothetical protein